ncbi:hypothetical protein ASF11_15900 [Acidovorax sp. Leaf76]|nr:hypothetical protein ASF11_15900 [Acidovorax sp. Leaf76]KQO30126.1 hypothetical protein ASF19_13580 [Acidovorax sp. Leaf84]KQS28806.1 hypothetical protein ASG27_10960 [Acidovorax sp. Leaf191]
MMLAAAANPLIKHDTQPAFVWLSTWLVPLIVAGVAFGLYFAVARQRARALWPNAFFVTAWLLLALLVADPYIEKATRGAPATPQLVAPAPAQDTSTAPAVPHANEDSPWNKYQGQ